MLSKADRWLARAEELFIAALILVASFLLFANVVARYGFNTAVLGAEELVRYMIIWLVFIGGSVAARKGIHIGVDAVLSIVGPSIARVISAVVLVFCIGFCIALAVYGFELVSATHSFGQRSAALRIPFWIAQVAIPIGAVLMALRFTQRLIALLQSREDEHKVEMIG